MRTLLTLVTSLAIGTLCLGAVSPVQVAETTDTKLLSEPAMSSSHVAFIYAGDLWVAGLDGKNVRRLTTDDGEESNPAFSPDGGLIAFSAQYDGNTDVFVVPVIGGVPTRLTWHPGQDVVQSFTADGSAVMFTSARAVFTGRYTQLFTVAVKGGIEQPLPIPNAWRAVYSPDGRRIAYNPLSEAFSQWKQYRGGRVSTISLYTVASHAVDKLPQPETRSNDTDPMWIGDVVYFRSDRNGEFNLFSFDPRTKAIKQLTTHDDFPILSASAGGGKIVYEQAGHLHVFDPRTNRSSKLSIGVTADLIASRPRFVKGARYIRNASISPSGARAAFEFRGEILTLPGEKGDPRNLTNTPAVHERSPAWSPDGRQVAYFSDESGEYELHVRSQDGKGDIRKFKMSGSGFYDLPVWSPDSQKMSFTDNSWTLYWLDLKAGLPKKIASEYLYGPSKTMRHTWSPDSKWIVYTQNTQAYIQSVWAYSIDQGKSTAITDGLSEVSEPAFDRSGKYLYFFGSTDAGPVKDWFTMSNADMRATRSIYLVVLRGDLPSPLAKESDEEKGPQPESKSADSKTDEAKDEKVEAPQKPDTTGAAGAAGAEKFTIDFDGIAYRILDLPIPAGDFARLQAGAAGHVYFLRRADGKSALQRYDLKTRKNETILPDVNDYLISADTKKMLYRTGTNWSIVPTTRKIEASEGRIAVESMEVRIDPRAEWAQIFHEAWRINRDYFYAPNMHGVDWTAMRKKYEPFLQHVADRRDLNRVIQWMCSELGVGHHRVGGGDNLSEPATVPGGLLGADYSIENERYRFKKVYGGLNWNPELRAPLTEPGVSVKIGEYLLAVQGKDLRPPTNLYSLFENTSGKIVEITVGPNPDGSASRTVHVVPVGNEGALRNRDWVENNIRKVEKATEGRVAYVYVPNTSTLGHTYFKRYFYPQSYKDAIIVDERFNGGGSVADYYIDILRRPPGANWAMRYGADLRTPTAAIHGPKVMIIDETAGSGGDLLPWMFKKYNLGPLVGKRTWGGLVGTLGFPVLMDGGSVTAPNLAIWTEDGWIVENVGVPPDIEVEQTPADVIAGRDPQLEKAIQIVLDELKKRPPTKLTRPPYPVRAGRRVTTSGQ